MSVLTLEQAAELVNGGKKMYRRGGVKVFRVGMEKGAEGPFFEDGR
jgi:hypothetical protein